MRNVLICFLKFPQPGHVKTRLAADLGNEAAANLYEALAERVITEVYPLEGNYDIKLCVDPRHSLSEYQAWIGDSWSFWNQVGEDLGARMTAAVTQALDEGYEQVILIGTDCIGMDEEFIDQTFASLAEVDFVIGPSTDGGYYLLALKQDDPWLFLNMAWGTEVVCEHTVERIEARDLTHKLLEEKIDIDTLGDLVVFRQGLPEEHFISRKVDQLVLERLNPPESIGDSLPDA